MIHLYNVTLPKTIVDVISALSNANIKLIPKKKITGANKSKKLLDEKKTKFSFFN